MTHTEETARAFREYIEANGTTHSFKLNGPSNLTVKNRAGAYKRVDLMGDTMFYPVSCYLGKRSQIIVCFKPRAPQQWVTMEMTLDEANEGLEGFVNYGGVFETRFEHVAYKAVEEVKHNRMEDPVYASW